MQKAIVTVVGMDKVGIIAAVCNYFSQTNINILDISQTIVDKYLNMVMVTDYSNATKDFRTVQEDMARLGDDIGIMISCQKEEIFEAMHRL